MIAGTQNMMFDTRFMTFLTQTIILDMCLYFYANWVYLHNRNDLNYQITSLASLTLIGPTLTFSIKHNFNFILILKHKMIAKRGMLYKRNLSKKIQNAIFNSPQMM